MKLTAFLPRLKTLANSSLRGLSAAFPVSRIGSIWEKNKGLETQKEFAISIMSSCEYDWEKGVLFELRKGKLIGDIFKRLDSSKLEKSMNLKGKFQKNFNVVVEEEV